MGKEVSFLVFTRRYVGERSKLTFVIFSFFRETFPHRVHGKQFLRILVVGLDFTSMCLFSTEGTLY